MPNVTVLSGENRKRPFAPVIATSFLRAVSPRYAVASAGGGNSFGHPHARVLADLEVLDCTCLRTDVSGTVVLVSDGRTLRIGP